MPSPAVGVFECFAGDAIRVEVTTFDPDRRQVAPVEIEVVFGKRGAEATTRPRVTVTREGKAEFVVRPDEAGLWGYVVRVTSPVVTTGEGLLRAKDPMFT